MCKIIMMINIAKSSDMTRERSSGIFLSYESQAFYFELDPGEKKMPNNFFTNALASGSGKAVEVN